MAKHCTKLQLENKASSGAQLQFTTRTGLYFWRIKHVRDLDGVRLMKTEATDTAAHIADLLEGMPHSSKAISRKPRCEEEAQPVQLVLPMEPARPLHNADVAAPIGDVGLAPPLDDVDLAARIDGVAYTEGPSDVCSTESVMAATADNSVRIVKNGVHLMETKAADNAAPSADMVEGMPHSSEAISRKPRCEEVLQSIGDVPLEQKDQGPKILSDSDVNAYVLELMKLGEAHEQLTMDFYSKAKAMLAATSVSDSDVNAYVLELMKLGEAHEQLAMDIYSKAKAMLAATSALKDVMVERPKSSVPPEATCKEEAQPVQLVLPVESAPPLDDVDAAAPIDDVGLDAPLGHVDLAARIDDVASTEGPLDVGLRPLDLSATEHVMAAEADNLVGTVEDGVRLMESKAVETAVPSADLVEAGMTHSSEDISRKQRCEEEVQLECQPEILSLLQMSTAQMVNLDALVNHAENRTDAVAYSEVLRSHDPCTVEQFIASKAKNLVATADHMEQIMPAIPENMSPKEKIEVHDSWGRVHAGPANSGRSPSFSVLGG